MVAQMGSYLVKGVRGDAEEQQVDWKDERIGRITGLEGLEDWKDMRMPTDQSSIW